MLRVALHCLFFLFFFNDTATTEIYTLSLHDALPIWDILVAPVVEKGATSRSLYLARGAWYDFWTKEKVEGGREIDRKSTRLNSSHGYISYAVFCLKKKKTIRHHPGRHRNCGLKALDE